MNIITHALMGWTAAQKVCDSRRDMAILTIASVAPDLDGAGILADLWKGSAAGGAEWYSAYHHVLGHNVFAGVIISCLALLLARRKFRCGALSFLLFHVHLLGDLVGSRGPDGDLWPIHFLYPWREDFVLAWNGQWEVNAWPNLLVTVVLLFLAFRQARDQGFSPLWYLSADADETFIGTLRNRFPPPGGKP